MRDLDKNFVVGRGDLLYGFAKGRDFCINRSPKLGAARLIGSWIIANDINDNTILRFNQFYTPNQQAPSEQEQIRLIEQALAQLGKVDEGMPFIKALYRRYSPTAVKNLSPAKLQRAGDSHNFKMIRRSCKFGVEYVAAIIDTHAKIHFVLDYMPNESEIVNKTKYGGRVPITVSELRYIFRNWDRLEPRILFYKNLRETFAPWQSNPQAWKPYAVERFNKYAKLAKKNGREDIVPNIDCNSISLYEVTRHTNAVKRQLGYIQK